MHLGYFYINFYPFCKGEPCSGWKNDLFIFFFHFLPILQWRYSLKAQLEMGFLHPCVVSFLHLDLIWAQHVTVARQSYFAFGITLSRA